MSESFTEANAHLLRRHLQAVVEVELFTIPIYLTAVYSFTDAALQGPASLRQVQQEALSVAVQEMYHLQCVCNVLNAFDVRPDIPKVTMPAGTDLPVPHLLHDGRAVTTRLGNMPEAIASMVEIEAPDPDPHFPSPNHDVEYPSISDLYGAMLQLLGDYFDAFHSVAANLDPHFDPSHKQVAILGFENVYNYISVDTRPDVANLVNAITDQGEGRIVASPAGHEGGPDLGDVLGALFQRGGDGVRPDFQPAPGSRFAAFGALTHYQRFEEIKAKISAAGEDAFYREGTPSGDLPQWARDAGLDAPQLEKATTVLWSYVIDVLQRAVAKGQYPPHDMEPGAPSFADAMFSFRYTLPLIWQLGKCPSFTYQPGVTAADVQDVMDAIDPLCLFHWDVVTARLRAGDQFHNACQGLNQCNGTGWGGLATTKGDGACATADFHTCGGNNSGGREGGCGFLVTSGGEGCGVGPAGAPPAPTQ